MLAVLGVEAVEGGWLDVVAFGWAEVGVVALAVLAIAGPVAGAIAVAGRVGVAVVAPVLLLLGNALAAASTGPQMLPGGWAGLGQALPPGAPVQALRSASFFDGSAVGGPLLVLGLWAAAGFGLVVTGSLAPGLGARGGRSPGRGARRGAGGRGLRVTAAPVPVSGRPCAPWVPGRRPPMTAPRPRTPR